MGANENMLKARAAKNDEFYTRMEDIEAEIPKYKDQFHGKVVYCNCEDPYRSQFVKFFRDNFEDYGLKTLVSTGYPQGETTGMGLTYFLDSDDPSTGYTMKAENGDFRTKKKLLQDADIIVTNPPFSLFREYMAMIANSGKKYCIIGNLNAVLYDEVFPHIRKGDMIRGNRTKHGFVVPGGEDDAPVGACWFTNMRHEGQFSEMELASEFDPERHKVFHNRNAINIDRTADMPRNYPGVMGVPVSFFDKYSPDQFEIVGLLDDPKIERDDGSIEILYARVLIKLRNPQEPIAELAEGRQRSMF